MKEKMGRFVTISGNPRLYYNREYAARPTGDRLRNGAVESWYFCITFDIIIAQL